MNYLKKKIIERKKYNEGLKRIFEESKRFTPEDFSQEYNNICKNEYLSEISKTFYLNRLKAFQLFHDVINPYSRLITYIMRNRFTELTEGFFERDYDVLPISYSELYEFLISLPIDEAEYILCKMNISISTMNKLLSAMENEDESGFVYSLESETNDLTRVCKQIRIFEMYYHFTFSQVDNLRDNGKIDISEVEVASSLLDEYINGLELNKKITDLNEEYTLHKKINNIIPEEYTNEIESYISQGLSPNFFFDYFKNNLILINRVITDFPIKLSKEEQECINEVLNSNEDSRHLIQTTESYVNLEKTEEYIEEVDFVIPDDFFSDKKYITESKEDEYIFSIYLSPTNDNNKKKIQALQTFINTIAENGYIEDNFNTKATFLYRITGRKLPNTKPEVIKWKDEMVKYNCLCHLVKNFKYDFLNILEKQKDNRVDNHSYEKALRFLGYLGEIDKNPSERAENIKRTMFLRYYEQFKSVCEKNK